MFLNTIKKIFFLVAVIVLVFLAGNAITVGFEKYQCSRMLDAIENNDMQKLESALKYGDPNSITGIPLLEAFAQFPEKLTPLQLACSKGNFEMVKFLVENGADVNYRTLNASFPPLWHASVESNNPEIVRYLIENGANVNTLSRYIERILRDFEFPSNGMEIIRELVNAGTDMSYKGYLYQACFMKREAAIRYFVEECGYDASDSYYLCGYCYGVQKYSIETFEYFLDRGANPYAKSLSDKNAIEHLNEESPEWAEKLIELAAEYGITE